MVWFFDYLVFLQVFIEKTWKKQCFFFNEKSLRLMATDSAKVTNTFTFMIVCFALLSFFYTHEFLYFQTHRSWCSMPSKPSSRTLSYTPSRGRSPNKRWRSKSPYKLGTENDIQLEIMKQLDLYDCIYDSNQIVKGSVRTTHRFSCTFENIFLSKERRNFFSCTVITKWCFLERKITSFFLRFANFCFVSKSKR